LLIVLFLFPATVAAQGSGTKAEVPASDSDKAIGVLIGLSPLAQLDQAPPANPAETDTETKTKGPVPSVTQGDAAKTIHHNSTEAESPYQTAWILKDAKGVHVRFLQDIIVPRRNGFWRLGSNTDSAKLENSTADIDFFWAAPVGTKPKLAQAGDEDLACSEQTSNKELDYVGPDYYGYSEFGSSICAHYGEGHYYAIASLDDPNGKHFGLDELLGLQAAEQHKRLNRLAATWSNEDCGESGFNGDAAQWTLKHSQGSWHAIAKFHGSGGGVCDRFDQDRTISVPLPKSLAANNVLSVSWKQIVAAFPGAKDAFPAPGGELLVVFKEDAALLVPIEQESLGKPIETVILPRGKRVMAEWALGANALRWDKELSSLPAPNPKARPQAPIP
jgi:hypothetical protein